MSKAVPEGWKILKLDDLSTNIHYGITAKATDKKMPFRMLRTTDIKNYNADMVAYLDIRACVNQNFAYIKPTDRLDSWFLFHLLDFQYKILRNSGRDLRAGRPRPYGGITCWFVGV